MTPPSDPQPSDPAPPDDPTTLPVRSRAQRRRPGRWEVRLQDREEVVVATDLSVGGLFLRDVTGHVPGTRLRLELSVGGRSLGLTATVQWVRLVGITTQHRRGSGLAFDPLTDADRACVFAALEEDSP